MKNKIFKLISVLTSICLILTAFSGCDRKYDEEEVKAAAKELIPKTSELNYIFWGKGIDYVKDESMASGNYYPANTADLQKYGFETIAELKVLCESVFSSDYSESIYESVFSSYGDGEGIYGLTRYYQKFSDTLGKEPECIMVYSKTVPLLVDEVEYLTDTLTVTHSKKDTVYVKLSVKVSRGESSQIREISVGLIEEEGIGWRIDTPTYVSYFDENAE